MKRNLQFAFIIILILLSNFHDAQAAGALIDFNFQSTTLPSGVTSDGTINPTKAADGVCGKGMIQVNSGQYLQVDINNCSLFRINSKSTSSSARTVSIKYKKDGSSVYTTLTPALSILAATSFDLTSTYPDLISSVAISIRIEPTSGNIQVHDLYVEGNTSLSTAAEITAFNVAGQIGTELINSTDGTIVISVPQGTSLTSVIPSTITLSAQASVSPLPTIAQDFSGEKEVTYTVTAQDGTTIKPWKVKIIEVASSLKEITAFKLSNLQISDAVINTITATISVSMPISEDITSLTPVTLTLSPYASIDPLPASSHDFSSPVTYTVTAQDNSTKIWTVTVVKVDPNAIYYSYQAEEAEFTGKTDISHANYTGTGFVDFLAGGENFIIFTVCEKQAGTQTAAFRYSLAKDDIRTGNLYVNDVFVKTLNFPRTALFTDWVEETATITLLAGVNKIKITWEITDGPNLDELLLTGEPCNSYSLNVTGTNGGTVIVAPIRTGNKYFENEEVKLLAEEKVNLKFNNWSVDATGTTNPVSITMTANKSITANFTPVNTYKVKVATVGIGSVELNPAGGEYAEGTVVTVTAKSILESTFEGWSGNLSGTTATTTLTIDGNKTITATFSSSFVIDFDKPVGFASVVTTTYPSFNGPTTGGLNSKDTLIINGPSEFDKLATLLYDRIKAYKNQADNLTAKYAPLTIILKEGIYTGTGTSATTFANSMLTIQEQGDLTILGEKNVVLKFGLNIKRSWNILIRNISFQDYYDDGINIGEPETHHIWVDHCNVGNPTTMPSNSEHPDGGIDIKTGASYVSISWCTYRNSWKTGLVGHSDSNAAEDVGKLKITYYGNYFYHTNSRNPRVRFGEVHVLNNLEDDVMLYGIAAANGAHVFAEGNFFLNTDWPMYADRTSADFKLVYGNNSDGVYTSKTGNYPAVGLKQTGNEYDDSGLPIITAQINPSMLNPGGRSIKFDEFNPELVFTPSDYYAYTAFSASVVRTIVPIFAGADKVSFTKVVTPPATPVLKAISTLTDFAQTVGSPSAIQTFSISGSNLTNNITVTPPANFEISADGLTWSGNGAGLTINQNNGSVANITLSVRMNAASANTFSGNITISSTGASNVLIAVSGKANPISSGIVNTEIFSIELFPNPVNDYVIVHYSQNIKTINLYTISGRKIKSYLIKSNDGQIALDVSTLNDGIYLLGCQGAGQEVFLKFVKN